METKHKWFSQDFLPLPADRNISGTTRPLMRHPGLWILREYSTTSCRIHDGQDTSLKRAQRCIVSSKRCCPLQVGFCRDSDDNGNVDVETWKPFIFIINYVLGCSGRFFLFPRRYSLSSLVSSRDRKPATSCWACVRQDIHPMTCGILSRTWHPSTSQILMSKTLKHYFLFQICKKEIPASDSDDSSSIIWL